MPVADVSRMPRPPLHGVTRDQTGSIRPKNNAAQTGPPPGER